MTYLRIWLDFLDAIAALGYAERGRLLTGMLEYASTGEEPQFSGNERIIWPMVKAQIDRDIAAYDETSKKCSEAGKRGGRPKREEKPQKALAFSKSQDKDKEKDKDNISPPIPPSRGAGQLGKTEIDKLISESALSPMLSDKLREWIAYKGKRAYKPQGIKALITRVGMYASEYSDAEVCGLIDESMANGYKGIVFDRLDRKSDRTSPKRQEKAQGSFDVDEFFESALAHTYAAGEPDSLMEEQR